MAQFFLVFVFTVAGSWATASSCCGQSPANFPLLFQGQRLRVATSYVQTRSVGRMFSDPSRFFPWDTKLRSVQTLGLNATVGLAERHQAFANTSVLFSRFRDDSSDGTAINPSDTLVGYSYEVLPAYRYSPWKPVIFASVMLNMPSGHSIYDPSALSEGADVSGHGQWGAGLGLTLQKVYFPWTLTLQGRTLRLLPKDFGKAQVSSFFDSSFSAMVNCATNFWGLHMYSGVTWAHLSPRTLAGQALPSDVSQNWTWLAGLQKSVFESWAVGLHYSDQTLLGPAKNSLLHRSFTLTLNYNVY